MTSRPMLETPAKSSVPAWLRPALALSATVLALLLLIRLLFLPDPTGNLWQKAGQFERNKLPAQALRVYQMIWRDDPASPYAPQALQRHADILTAQARRDGDTNTLRQAALLYEKLGSTYVESPLSGPAFVTAGVIAMDELRDAKLAGRCYLELLNRYPNNPDYAAEATVRLGRLAIASGQKERARDLLQRALLRFPQQAEASAQAQYHLGVAYETLFRNREWAQDAFYATIRRYPTSLWASAARGRLGLLAYREAQGRPRARRVLVRVPPLPQIREGDALSDALKPLLAARGLEFSDTILQGMTLRPFVTGFSPRNARSIVKMQGDPALNIAANAGLTVQLQRGGNALSTLQESLDGGRPSAVFLGKWRLCVGYDSSLKQVLLSDANGAIEAQDVKTFDALWAKSRALDTTRPLLTLFARGDKPQEATGKPAPDTTPTPSLTPAKPRPTPTISRAELLQTPTWEFALSPLKPDAALRRTLSRAAILLRRTSDNDALLNGAALDELAKRCDRFASLRAPIPQTQPTQPTPFSPDAPLPPPADAVPPDDATPDDVAPAEFAPARFSSSTVRFLRVQSRSTPSASPRPTPRVLPSPTPTLPPAGRWRVLSAWFDAPLTHYIDARQASAEFCDEAANALKNPNLKTAGDAFRFQIAALEAARSLVPTATPDSEAGRQALRDIARQLRLARQQERRAAQIMTDAAN